MRGAVRRAVRRAVRGAACGVRCGVRAVAKAERRARASSLSGQAGSARPEALPYPTLPYPTLPYPTLPYPTLEHLHLSSNQDYSGAAHLDATLTKVALLTQVAILTKAHLDAALACDGHGAEHLSKYSHG